MTEENRKYRRKKSTLPPELVRRNVPARIQSWMIDELKSRGEIGVILEEIITDYLKREKGKGGPEKNIDGLRETD